jgi:Raf kinase inhibitor-like YbhB/YbcL family protein
MNPKHILTFFAVLLCFTSNIEGSPNMKVTSPDFANNTYIPEKFSCDGDDVNPGIVIDGIPENAKSLALIIEDPDAPMRTWIHWILYDIPAAAQVRIEENSVPGKQGNNDFGKKDYRGPCPPGGTHRYFFKVYALDKMLDLRPGLSKADLEKAMNGHILESAELVGLYKRAR